MMEVIYNNSLFSLQKLCVSVDVGDKLSGEYVLVTVKSNLHLLCQLFTRRGINSKYCILNKSVILVDDLDTSKIFRGKLDSFNFKKHLRSDELKVIEPINNLKNINVSIVFQNAYFTSKWNSKAANLKLILKEVLKLFVVTRNVVVFPDSVKVCKNIGVYCVVVHSTDLDFGRITSATNVTVESIISKNWFQSDKTIPCISGVSDICKKLKEHCLLESKRVSSDFSFNFSNNVLLSGPPGCGKTTLVHFVASDCQFPLLSIAGPELCNPEPGYTEKAIKNVFNEAKLLASEKPNGVCVLLLDQIESLCGSKSSLSHVARIQSTILQLLDSLVLSPGVIVIATTDQPDSLSPAIRRPPRFNVELVMGVPSETERYEMISSLCKDCEMNISNDVCLEVASWTPGYVAGDLKLLVADTAQALLKLPTDSMDENCLDVWQSCVLNMRPSTLRGELGIVSNSDVKLSDIGGMSSVKKTLKKAVEWPFLHYESFKRLGIPPTKGILLYGPPGCAKTSLARAIASGCNTTFLTISAAALYSPYVGDAERTVSRLFQRARLGAPSILFIDEIDALVGSRGDDTREKGVHERVLSSFLIEMDGIGIKVQNNFDSKEDVNKPSVIVIAATNQPHLLDSALLRPGRFDRLVYVGPPDRNERLDILSKLTRKIPLGDSVDLNHIADITTLFSGADLSSLCKEAGLIALTEEGMDVKAVEQKHWIQAFENMKPSITKEQIDKYKAFSI